MADAYLTWEDLLDAPDDEAAGGPVDDARAPVGAPATLPGFDGGLTRAAPRGGLPALPDGVALPDDVRRLLAEREVLEGRIKVLTGQAPPPEEQDAHLRARFPVKVHTKESRIEERRLDLRDQLRRMTTKRLQESVLVA